MTAGLLFSGLSYADEKIAESDRIRTGFRGEAEHDSGMIPNSIPG